jgi:hypothetical protein
LCRRVKWWTLERIELDETAVGTMGIEWASQRALSLGEEECAVAGDGGERKSATLGPWLAEAPTDNDQVAMGRAEFGPW